MVVWLFLAPLKGLVRLEREYVTPLSSGSPRPHGAPVRLNDHAEGRPEIGSQLLKVEQLANAPSA